VALANSGAGANPFVVGFDDFGQSSLVIVRGDVSATPVIFAAIGGMRLLRERPGNSEKNSMRCRRCCTSLGNFAGLVAEKIAELDEKKTPLCSWRALQKGLGAIEIQIAEAVVVTM